MTAVKCSSCRTSGSAFASRGGEGTVHDVSGATRYRVRTRRPRKCTSVLMLSAAFSGCLSIRDEEVLVFLKFFFFVCFFLRVLTWTFRVALLRYLSF